MYLIAGRPPEHVSPEPLGEGPPRPPLDPESLSASRPISRTTSAFALPGFGYTHGFSTQPSLPRYVRLQVHSNDQGCNDLGNNGDMIRYDSLPPVSPRKQLLSEAVASPDLPGADGLGPIRALSAPNMPTLLKDAQLQSVLSATPQSQAWGSTLLGSTSKATTARSVLSDADSASQSAAVDTVSLPAQSRDVMLGETPSTNWLSELSPLAASETAGLSVRATDVMPSEMHSRTVHSEVLPFAGLDTVNAPAQATDAMPAERPSRNVHSQLLPIAALDTVGIPAEATDIMPPWMLSNTVHPDLLQHADELDSAAPLLDDSQPSSFQLPPGLLWTQNDSFDDPDSDLQQDFVQNGASSVSHTD